MIDDRDEPWTDGTRARWQRIRDHAFEDAQAPLDFVAKLAREQDWSRAEALAAIEAYLPLHNDALVVTREHHGEIVVLRSTLLGPGARVQATDIAVAMQHRILRQLTGPAWEAEEVCLSRPRPADLAKFRQVLGPRLRFDADFDGIVIRADLLDSPNPMAEAALRPYASQMLRLADPGAGESMADRVRRVLALLLSSGRCTAGHVAQHLGLSRRTLTRALEAEGTRFLALLDTEREEVALRHLSALLAFPAAAPHRPLFAQMCVDLLRARSGAAQNGHVDASTRTWREHAEHSCIPRWYPPVAAGASARAT
mgnify:CR=1 FL=1